MIPRVSRRRSLTAHPWFGLVSLGLALAFAACAHYLLEPSERVVAGRAFATDGDTIRIGNSRIRLKGIDAPELSQSCVRDGHPVLCGENARNKLLSIIL